MRSKKVVEQLHCWGIWCRSIDGVDLWLTDAGGPIVSFRTKRDADTYIKKTLRMAAGWKPQAMRRS